MDTLSFAVISLAVLAFALGSAKFANSILTPPMVFAVFGFLVGPHGANLAAIDLDGEIIRTLAELTLVLVLFTDAARIDIRRLATDHTLPVRLLAIAMPLTFILGTVAAWALFSLFALPLGWIEAALVAAVLTPTDAALGQVVVISKIVPARVRQALNVESGLNDGLALPAILILVACGLAVAQASPGAEQSTLYWVEFVGKQLVLGPLVGIGVGLFGGLAVDRAARAGWMTLAFQGITALGLALIAFAAAELVGGNGFISAFVAGLVMGATKRSLCTYLFEFAETQGQLLTLLTFMIFGAAMVPQAFEAVTAYSIVPVLIYAVLSLTILRMAPTALGFVGMGLKTQSVVFIGWFGPRGLASILFALLVAESGAVADPEFFLAIVVATVALSIAVHGLTAAPGVRWYGRAAAAFIQAEPASPEQMPVVDLPTRVSRGILAAVDEKDPGAIS
jgi:NhaP-type Na+/H+ or K+/H+ antiporter